MATIASILRTAANGPLAPGASRKGSRKGSRTSRKGSRKGSRKSSSAAVTQDSVLNRVPHDAVPSIRPSPFSPMSPSNQPNADSGEIDPCRFYCDQSYRKGVYLPECGYRRLREPLTGRFYYEDTPTNRNCLSAEDKDGFELESAQVCEVWKRMFTRQDLLRMLEPYLSAEGAKELKYLSKKELCTTLSNKAAEVYYELEKLIRDWCGNLKRSLESPEMRQVFALLRLPPPETFYDKNQACAELLKRVAEMKPPWYSRVWRYMTTTTRDLFSWVTSNPGKTMLLAAGLVAGIYFAPQIASTVQSTAASAQEAVSGLATATQNAVAPYTSYNYNQSALSAAIVPQWPRSTQLALGSSITSPQTVEMLRNAYASLAAPAVSPTAIGTAATLFGSAVLSQAPQPKPNTATHAGITSNPIGAEAARTNLHVPVSLPLPPTAHTPAVIRGDTEWRAAMQNAHEYLKRRAAGRALPIVLSWRLPAALRTESLNRFY